MKQKGKRNTRAARQAKRKRKKCKHVTHPTLRSKINQSHAIQIKQNAKRRRTSTQKKLQKLQEKNK
jgi:hypothetical protein